MNGKGDYSMFKVLQILFFILLIQSINAADEVIWTNPTISGDGNTLVRLGYINGIEDHQFIGFFSSDNKLRRSVKDKYKMINHSISQDGYLLVTDEGLEQKGLSLYCPFGHLIWRVEIGNIPYPHIAIANNGEKIAILIKQHSSNKNDELVIYDADGKKINSYISPIDAREIVFLNNETLLMFSSKNIIAFDIKNGKNIWVANVESDFYFLQSVAISPDQTSFLLVDFIRNKIKNDMYITPRMRVFDAKIGEKLKEKIFENRSFNKLPDQLRVNYDIKMHQFSISTIDDMVIDY